MGCTTLPPSPWTGVCNISRTGWNIFQESLKYLLLGKLQFFNATNNSLTMLLMEKIKHFCFFNFLTWYEFQTYTGDMPWQVKFVGGIIIDYHLNLSGNGFWSLNCTLVMWPKWWCHQSSQRLFWRRFKEDVRECTQIMYVKRFLDSKN